MNEFVQSLKNLKIGLTVLIGIVIFLVLIFLVGTESNTFTSTYRIRLFLPNINGLANGSMVTLGGLKIGNVDALEFGERNWQPGVIITAKLRTRFQPQITTGSVASVKTIGMLGDKFIDITIGTPSEQSLADNSFITVRTTQELGEVLDQFAGVIGDMSAAAANVRAITDTVRRGRGTAGRLLVDNDFAREVSGITQKMHLLASSLTDRSNTLGRLLQDDGLYLKLDRTAANFSSLTDSLRAGRGTAGKLLANDSLYVTLRSISRRIDLLFDKMDSDSSSVGPILNSRASLEQMSELVNNINSLVEDIRENPKKYVHLSLF